MCFCVHVWLVCLNTIHSYNYTTVYYGDNYILRRNVCGSLQLFVHALIGYLLYVAEFPVILYSNNIIRSLYK